MANINKRKHDNDNEGIIEILDDDDDDDIQVVESKAKKQNIDKPACIYGSKCYRKNPLHFQEYSHQVSPSKSSEEDKKDDSTLSKYIYLTKVHNVRNSSKINEKLSLSLKDILSIDKNNYVESAQFNYMHDLDWLIEQYPSENQDKPLTLIYGDNSNDAHLKSSAKSLKNVKLVKAKIEAPYGTHHTKMMLILYKTGMRVVVHTANLIEQDWNQKTQGIWISDLFPKISKPTEPGTNLAVLINKSDSKTKFKQYLLMYLEYYKNDLLNEWIEHIKFHDMSSANVFLIGSVPGRFPSSKKIFGHVRMRKILSDYFDKDIEEKTADQLVYQFSSIGSLGPNEGSWLCKELTISFSTSKTPSRSSKPLCIYPSVENVRTSYEGYSAGNSLPYSKSVAAKQSYLNNFLYKWKADLNLRSKASPHIKTYARYSNNFDKLYWFLLTSSNLSKAAWGSFEKNDSQYFIRSYEMGVLFIPSVLESKTYFKIGESSEFLVPYDLPPEKYDPADKPWIVDNSYTEDEDSHGRIWKIC